MMQPFSLENVSVWTILATVILSVLILVILTSSTVTNFRRWLFAQWYYHIDAKYSYQVYGPLFKPVIKGLEENLKIVGGDIVDLGTGYGTILEYLPKGSSVIAVEPSAYMREKLQVHAAKYPDVKIKKVVDGFAENLSEIESGSVAAVTCALLLCSVNDIDQVLKEVRRILKPGGYFCFMEHVKAPQGTKRRVLQYLLNRVSKSLFDGCALTCEPWINMEKAGFKELEYEFHLVDAGMLVFDDILTGYAK